MHITRLELRCEGSLPGLCSWFVLGLGGKSSALVEVCYMTVAQHTSTNCDPGCSTGCSQWLMLNKCLAAGLLRLYHSRPHVSAYYIQHTRHCLSPVFVSPVLLWFTICDFIPL